MTTDPLLQPFRLKHLTLKNRVMSTSHEPAYPEDGMPKERYRAYHVERARAGIATGYSAPALDAWAKVAHTFARGSEPKEFARVGTARTKPDARDVYVFFINGAKERAPAAACVSALRAAASSISLGTVIRPASTVTATNGKPWWTTLAVAIVSVADP